MELSQMNNPIEKRRRSSSHNVTFSESYSEINIDTGSLSSLEEQHGMTKIIPLKRVDSRDLIRGRIDGMIKSNSNLSLDFHSSQIELETNRKPGVRKVCMKGVRKNISHENMISARNDTKVSTTARDILEGLWSLSRTLLALLLLVSFSFFAFTPGPSIISFHIFFMALGWIYLMTYALNAFSSEHIVIQIFNVDNNQNKHMILQIACLIFVIIGYIAAFMHKSDNNIRHCDTFHDFLGLITLVLALVNVFGGFITRKCVNSSRSTKSLLILLIHSILGLITFIFGVASILAMFYSDWWDGGYFCRNVFMILICIHMLCTIFRPLIKVYFRIKMQIQEKYD